MAQFVQIAESPCKSLFRRGDGLDDDVRADHHAETLCRAQYPGGTMKRHLLVALFALVAVPAMAAPIRGGGSACVRLTWGTAEEFTGCASIDDKGAFSFRNEEPLTVQGEFTLETLRFEGNADPCTQLQRGRAGLRRANQLHLCLLHPDCLGRVATHATSSLSVGLIGLDRSLPCPSPRCRRRRSCKWPRPAPPFPGTPLGVDAGSACSGSGTVLCPTENAAVFCADHLQRHVRNYVLRVVWRRRIGRS